MPKQNKKTAKKNTKTKAIPAKGYVTSKPKAKAKGKR